MQPILAEARYAAPHEGDEPIPGFRLVRRRGRGGFGEVWEAEAPGGFLVALKFVRLSSGARAAELRALEFVRGIHHPNLLANFGSWQVGDTLIIGMELADRSLWDRYVEAAQQGLRGIPRGELLGYLAEVAAGIGHLNEYRHTLDGRPGFGIQHRDLKPSNILLFGGGAKVADLGMARAMDTEVAGHTGIWTFAYAAPEFFRGETTRQSDQYGLAATYCQLRGGQLPFDGSAATMTAGHLFGEPDLGALPEPERPIVARALAKVPADRWPDCRAFIEALRALPQGSVPDVLIDPDGPSDIPREFRSSTGAMGRLSADPGGLASAWRAGESGDPGRDPGTSASGTGADPFPDPFPSWDVEAPLSPDVVPTRIFETVTPDPGPSAAIARPRRGWGARIGLSVVAAGAIALVSTSVHAPTHPAPPTASPVSRPDSSAMVLADGIGSAAEADPDPVDPTPTPTPLPTFPSGAMVAARAPEPAPEAAPAPAEPSRPTPVPDPIAVASPPVPSSSHPVLEGPIEMGTVSPRAPAPLSVTRAEEPPKPEVPASAGDPGASDDAPVPPEAGERPEAEAGEPGKADAPPIPARNLPPAAPRMVAHNRPAGNLEAVPDRGPAAEAVAPGARSAEEAFKRGQDLFLRGSFLPAFAAFDEAIRLDPGHLPSYFPRAVARHRAGDPRAALADYAEAIRVMPDDAATFISRGQAYHELREYRRAIGDYDEAIRRMPGNSDAQFRRGLARYKLADYGGAVVDFNESLRLDPKNRDATEFRAEAIARLIARNAQAPGTAPGRPAIPSNAPGGAEVTAASGAGVQAPGTGVERLPIRETSYDAAPPAAAAQPRASAPPATARPKAAPQPQPQQQQRRRSPGIRLPWPIGRLR